MIPMSGHHAWDQPAGSRTFVSSQQSPRCCPKMCRLQALSRRILNLEPVQKTSEMKQRRQHGAHGESRGLGDVRRMRNPLHTVCASEHSSQVKKETQGAQRALQSRGHNPHIRRVHGLWGALWPPVECGAVGAQRLRGEEGPGAQDGAMAACDGRRMSQRTHCLTGREG